MKLIGIKVFIVLMYFLAYKKTYSQAGIYRFENITHEQGLADRLVNAIIKDKQGFIWIGSEEGLTRYDGYTCIVYSHETADPYSLSDNAITSLCIDNSGVLWVGTRNGLNRYDQITERFEVFKHDDANQNSLASNLVFALAKDGAGNIWAGTYGGGADKISQTRNGDWQFVHHRHDDKDSNSISGNQVFSICFDKKGNGWFGSTDGLNMQPVSSNKFIRYYHHSDNIHSISTDNISKIFIDNNGTTWVCGNNMLDKITIPIQSNPRNILVRHVLPEIVGKNFGNWFINDFITDNNGRCWVASNDLGVISFIITKQDKISEVQHFENSAQNPYSLAASNVFCLYNDGTGVSWIGTAKGVSKFISSKTRFNEINFLKEGIPDFKFVQAILSDRENRIWLVEGALTIIANNNNGSYTQKIISSISDGKDFEQINTLYKSSNGDIYIGTFSDGFFRIPATLENIYDKKQWIHISRKTNPLLPDNNIYSFAEDENGLIWVGTFNGLCNFNPATKKLMQVYVPESKLELPDYIIWSIVFDADKTLWCGTENGICLIRNNKVIKTYKSETGNTKSLSHNSVINLFKDRQNNIWAGTKEGLNLFQKKSDNFTRFTTKNGLPDDGIRSIIDDKNGNIWIATNHGLARYNSSRKEFYSYGIADGLSSDQFVTNSVSSNNSGILFFGTNNGLVTLNPENIYPNNYKPPIAITQIKILNQPIESIGDTLLLHIYQKEKKLLLRYNQNFFSFEFAALNYINTTKNQYAYMLEKVDADWIYSGTQRFAGYTDIKPGHYLFKVKAANNDGLWNDVPEMVEVIISPPWWQTWWFYTLCVLAVIALAYLIYSVRVRQVLKLYRLRSSIAKDLHDDVGSALSSIALLSRIANDGKTKARLHPDEIFSRIGDTSKRMIDLMDDIVWSVNPDNDRFSNMLVRMREYAVEMLESKNINFSFKVSKDIDALKIPMQMRKDYFLIFKEGVNNLAKYSECVHAAITIERIGRHIVTSIIDDGIGFNTKNINSRNGLKNMQQRATDLKGKLDIQSQPGKGTQVVLAIPVS